MAIEKKDLPQGWIMQRLEHLITMKKGKAQEPLFNEQVAGSKPHILVESFDGIYKKYTTSTNGELCNKDDILMIWDGSRYGLIATNLEGYVGSTLGIISTKSDVIKDYLFYLLKLNYDKIREQSKGSGIPHIDKKFLLNLKVIYPQNKVEQQKIVDKLDKQMAHIEMMKKEAEKTQTALFFYNQTNGNPHNIGRCSLFDLEGDNYVFASYLIRARVKTDKVVPEFIDLLFKSGNARGALLSKAKTSVGNYNINTVSLRNIRLRIPSIEIQKQIVARYHEFLDCYNKSMGYVNIELNAINQLPNSILNEVFGQYQINS